MKRLWVVLGLFVLFLAGCSASASEGNLEEGEVLYNNRCLVCHGADLEGTSGPPVAKMANKYSKDELFTLIYDGVGMMPGKLLTEEESQIVTDWLMEQN